MIDLEVECCCDFGEVCIEWYELYFGVDFLFFVGECLLDVVGGGVGGIGEIDFVVVVVGCVGLEVDCVDCCCVGMVFVFDVDFGLVVVDLCVMIGVVDVGDVVE